MRDHGTMTPAGIIASVRETQDELMAIYRSVPEAQAQWKPAEDEWSMHQLALHTAFTERLVGKLVYCMARSSPPAAEDLEGAGIGMMPKDDRRGYGEALDELGSMNGDLLDVVGGLPAAPDMEMKLPHPFFGPLNCLEWAGFQRVHDLDHIQHARKILAASTQG